MEVRNAVRLQSAALLGCDHRGHKAARFGIGVEPVEQVGEPCGHRSTAHFREFLNLREIRHRQDARNDFVAYTARGTAVAVAQVDVGVEKILRDGAVGPCVELGLEKVDVGLGRRRIGMRFGIGAHRDVEIGDTPNTRHEIVRVGVAVGVRRVFRLACLRVAAQGHDVAHARRPVAAHHLVDFGARGGDASEMGRGRHVAFGRDALDDRVRALARRSARAVGDRNEAGPQRRQALERGPQLLVHLFVLGREEFETDGDRTRRGFAAEKPFVHGGKVPFSS
jgi:hypothetical protein